MERNSSKSAVFSDLLKIVSIAANTDSPVLIEGEGSRENEFFAKMLHYDGARREQPFVRFGRQAPFLDCVKNAGKGTLFIEELSLLDSGAQNILLRLVRNKEECGARFVAASRFNLDELVMQGKFNGDLLSLLSGVLLRVPILPEQLIPSLKKVEPPAENQIFSSGAKKTLKEAETEFRKAYVQSVLKTTNFNQTKAAEILGIQRTYLSRLLAELGIRK